MTISTINVEDMHCSACCSKIRAALDEIKGIEKTHINPVRRQVLVEHNAQTDSLEILRSIEAAGFNPALTDNGDHDEDDKNLLKRLGIAGLAMMQVMMAAVALYAGDFGAIDDVYRRLLEYTSLIFCIPVVSYSAMPFFSSAISSLRSPTFALGMDVPIALAIAIAFVVSLTATITGSGEVYYDSVAMFTFLLLGARYIDNRLKRRFNVSRKVLAALPRSASRFTADGVENVPVAHILPDDELLVAEGEQIPVDGVLISTSAVVDEAILTGESEWIGRQTGDPVFAGTMNCGAGMKIRATQPFNQTRLADISSLADQAELQRAPVVALADRIAGVFVPAILGLAALTYFGWQLADPAIAVEAALTVLVVSCPCALSLATPAALTAAMTRMRQSGVVLTRSGVVEQLAQLRKVFIDKTGTLTIHEPHITDVHLLIGQGSVDDPMSEMDCLALARALQMYSSHPLAKAFRSDSNSERKSTLPVVSNVKTVTGRGVEGRWKQNIVRVGSAAFCHVPEPSAAQAVYLSVDGRPVCYFLLSDQVRADASTAINALKHLGVTPVMLSGDSAQRCLPIARELDIEFMAGQTPESKLAQLRSEKASHAGPIMMVGDGINDVPTLAGADISATVVEATDLVKSKADVLLLTRKLIPLVELLHVSHKTVNIIRQNLAWALAYNITAIPLAAFGFMPPWLAALGMASSSTLVMLNAVRLVNQPASIRSGS